MASASAQRHGLARAYPEILVEPEPGEGEHGRRPPRGVPRREKERDRQGDPRPHHTAPERGGEWAAGEEPRGAGGVEGGMPGEHLGFQDNGERDERGEQDQAQPPWRARASP